MAANHDKLIALMGISVQGDFGPLTMYTSRRGKIVWFDRSPPLNPRSQLQLLMQDRWRSIARLWKTLSIEERQTWETACKKASVPITGYNLFVYANSAQDWQTVRTIERQSKITLDGVPNFG